MEGDYVMRVIHVGDCDINSGADSLVLKLIRVGYYWPQMDQDAKSLKYDKCQ